MKKRFLKGLLPFLAAVVLGITGIAHGQSTAGFIPLPIGTTIAGVASTSQGSAYTNPLATCSTGFTNSLNSTSYNIGDNCSPLQATIVNVVDAAVDSYGNVYWADTGGTVGSTSVTGTVRVLYKGGATAAALIYGANSWNSAFTAAYSNAAAVAANGTGKVFSVGGGYASALSTKSGSWYECAASASYPATGYTTIGDGCPATLARFTALHAITVDQYGNIYIASGQASSSSIPEVRVIYAGGTQVTNLIETLNTSSATGVSIPVVGYVYALGFYNDNSSSSKYGTYGDGGLATNAAIINPSGIAVDSKGNIFVADGKGVATQTAGTNSYQKVSLSGNNVREIFGVTSGGNQLGYVTTVAGETACGGDYINSSGKLISKSVDSADAPSSVGVVNGISYYPYVGYGAASGSTPYGCPTSSLAESFTGSSTPYTMAYYPPYSNYYDGDGYPAAGAPPCASCSGSTSYANSGYINYPSSIALDANDNLYIAEYGSNRIRVVYNSGTLPSAVYSGFGSAPVAGDIYTYAGVANGGSTGYNGAATFPTSNNYTGLQANNAYILLGETNGSGAWTGIGVDPSGNVYSYESADRILWKIDPSTYTAIRWLGGPNYNSAPAAGSYCNGGTNGPKSTDAYGSGCPALESYVNPAGKVVFDNAGNLYMANPGSNSSGTGTNVIQEYSFNSQFPATADGSTNSQYVAFEEVYNPLGVSSPSAGVTPSAFTLALQGNTADSEFSLSGTANANGCSTGTAVSFRGVCAFLVNFTPSHPGLRSGSLTLSGTSTASGASATVSGASTLSGVGTAADLAIDAGTSSMLGTGIKPTGVAADQNGNVYVADSTGNQVLKGASSGTALTALISGLSSPSQVAVDYAGNIYVADTGNNRVLIANASGTTLATTGAQLSSPKGIAVDAYGNSYAADTGNNRLVRVALTGYIAPVSLQTSSGIAITLSSPTELAADASGNLYILDAGNSRIVEVPSATNGGSANASVVTLDTGVVPAGIALDTAGDLYVADSSSGKVYEYYLGATPGTALLNGLTTPVSLAVDADANLFVADSGASGLIEDKRSTGLLNFTSVSSANATLNNVGNSALTLTSPIDTVSGANPSVFTVASASSNGCTAASYAVGATCGMTVSFAPSVVGSYTAGVSFNSNAANSATLSLNGTVTSLIRTPTVVVTPTSSSITTQQSVSVTVSVNGTPTPTGTVTLTSGSYTSAATTLSNGSATFNLTAGTLAVGIDTLTASYTPDSNSSSTYRGATGTSSVQVSMVTPTVKVTPASSGITIQQSLSVTVTINGTPTPTGKVTLTSGSYSSAATTLSSGSATITIAAGALPTGTNTLTASYTGDGNYNPSTGIASVTISGLAVSGPGTGPVIPPTSGKVGISVPPGGNFGNTATITVTPSGGFTGSVSLAAAITSSPTNAQDLPTLSFGSTGTVNITGTTAATATLTVNTTAVGSSALEGSRHGNSRWSAAGEAMLGCLLLVALPTKSRRTLRALGMFLIVFLAVGGFSACSNSTSGAGTTAGIYTITVTATATNLTVSTTIPLEVQ